MEVAKSGLTGLKYKPDFVSESDAKLMREIAAGLK